MKELKEEFKRLLNESYFFGMNKETSVKFDKWVKTSTDNFFNSIKEPIKQEGIEENRCITCHYNKPKKYVICKKCIHNLSDYWLTKQ